MQNAILFLPTEIRIQRGTSVSVWALVTVLFEIYIKKSIYFTILFKLHRSYYIVGQEFNLTITPFSLLLALSNS